MTFRQEVFPYYKDFPLFIQWILRVGTKYLFFKRELFEDDDLYRYDLTSKAYIFMKRLHTDYNTFMQMPEEERERLFRMEMDLIEKENKEAEEAKNKK